MELETDNIFHIEQKGEFMALLQKTPYDLAFYEEHLKDFLPDTFIDCHTHIWLDEFMTQKESAPEDEARTCAWTELVAKDNPIEDLIQTNLDLFPGKKVIPVLYPHTDAGVDTVRANDYVLGCSKKYHFPALYLARPEQSVEEIEQKILEGGYAGLKVYLEFAPSYIPTSEIRIYDFVPHEQLALADKHGWVVQVHIARPKRLADPVNYVQLYEIEQKYPNLQLIVAHLGRAYADSDIGNALEYLKSTEKTIWDFTANTNDYVMEQVLRYFGPKRFIYGSDFPIFRMRARRVIENDFYINEIPANSLGDVSVDSHMREIPYPEADKITFFIYEEMLSCKKAAERLGLRKSDINDIFYQNAAKIFRVE